MNCPETVRSFALLPAVEALAALRGRDVRFSVLRPPYAALGVGALRVLRIAEREATLEMVAGYDGYERLAREGRPGHAP